MRVCHGSLSKCLCVRMTWPQLLPARATMQCERAQQAGRRNHGGDLFVGVPEAHCEFRIYLTFGLLYHSNVFAEGIPYTVPGVAFFCLIIVQCPWQGELEVLGTDG